MEEWEYGWMVVAGERGREAGGCRVGSPGCEHAMCLVHAIVWGFSSTSYVYINIYRTALCYRPAARTAPPPAHRRARHRDLSEWQRNHLEDASFGPSCRTVDGTSTRQNLIRDKHGETQTAHDQATASDRTWETQTVRRLRRGVRWRRGQKVRACVTACAASAVAPMLLLPSLPPPPVTLPLWLRLPSHLSTSLEPSQHGDVRAAWPARRPLCDCRPPSPLAPTPLHHQHRCCCQCRQRQKCCHSRHCSPVCSAIGAARAAAAQGCDVTREGGAA